MDDREHIEQLQVDQQLVSALVRLDARLAAIEQSVEFLAAKIGEVRADADANMPESKSRKGK